MNKIHIIASFGGHLVQLTEITDSLQHKYIITTEDIGNNSFNLPDCNFNTPFKAILCLISSMQIIIKEKPKYVITTGALPGLIYLICSRLFGAKTLWIDSLANSEKVSRCCILAQYLSNQCITQWPKLQTKRIKYKGSIL